MGEAGYGAKAKSCIWHLRPSGTGRSLFHRAISRCDRPAVVRFSRADATSSKSKDIPKACGDRAACLVSHRLYQPAFRAGEFYRYTEREFGMGVTTDPSRAPRVTGTAIVYHWGTPAQVSALDRLAGRGRDQIDLPPRHSLSLSSTDAGPELALGIHNLPRLSWRFNWNVLIFF